MYMSSTTFQILSALKTVATGILFRVILKRQLDDVQKVAILLLACGAATSQIPLAVTCSAPEVRLRLELNRSCCYKAAELPRRPPSPLRAAPGRCS